MPTLTSTVIDRVLKGFRILDQPDVLATAMNSSVTALNFQGILNAWGPSTIAEVGSELMLVTEVDDTNKIATVIRGWLGTTATTHAQNAPIYINPRMLRSDVLTLVNECLEDMFGRDLYAVNATTIIYNPAIIGYSLPDEVIDVLRVDALQDSAALYWLPIADWIYVDNADTGDFSTGKALMLRTALPPGEFRVVYSERFTQVAEADDLEAVGGLRPYMTDLPFYYAMNRLMVDSERSRSKMKAAEQHQRAQDSPPFLALRTGEWYQARYADRVNTSRATLLKETKRLALAGYGS